MHPATVRWRLAAHVILSTPPRSSTRQLLTAYGSSISNAEAVDSCRHSPGTALPWSLTARVADVRDYHTVCAGHSVTHPQSYPASEVMQARRNSTHHLPSNTQCPGKSRWLMRLYPGMPLRALATPHSIAPWPRRRSSMSQYTQSSPTLLGTEQCSHAFGDVEYLSR